MLHLLRDLVATVRENAGGAGRGGASATTPSNHRMSTVVFITGTKANVVELEPGSGGVGRGGQGGGRGRGGRGRGRGRGGRGMFLHSPFDVYKLTILP